MFVCCLLCLSVAARAAVLFNSSASWQVSSSVLVNSSSLGLPSVTTDDGSFNAMMERGPSLCVRNEETNNYIGLQHSRNGTMMLRLEVRHAVDSELLVRVNGQVQISLNTDEAGVLKLDGFGPNGAAQNVPDPVLWAIGGVFRPPLNTTLFSVGCAWTNTSCHCYVHGGALAGYKSIVDNQATFSSMNRILGRFYANYCVRDVVVLDETVDSAVVLAFLEGTGTNVDVTSRSPTSTTATATTIAPSSTSTVATVSAPVATTATATSSAATSSALIATGSIESSVVSGVTSSAVTSSTLIATVIASTSATGSIESWVVGVIVGGALLVLLLVGLAAFCVLKRRRVQRNPPVAAEMQASQYAAIPPRINEYDNGRLAPAPSDYASGPMNVDG